MALIHYLYAGHFVLEEGFVKFVEPAKFTVERHINMATVRRLLVATFGCGADLRSAFDKCGLEITDEFLVCNLYGRPEALRFCADYVETEGGILVDMGSLSTMTSEQVRERASGQ